MQRNTPTTIATETIGQTRFTVRTTYVTGREEYRLAVYVDGIRARRRTEFRADLDEITELLADALQAERNAQRNGTTIQGPDYPTFQGPQRHHIGCVCGVCCS